MQCDFKASHNWLPFLDFSWQGQRLSKNKRGLTKMVSCIHRYDDIIYNAWDLKLEVKGVQVVQNGKNYIRFDNSPWESLKETELWKRFAIFKKTHAYLLPRKEHWWNCKLSALIVVNLELLMCFLILVVTKTLDCHTKLICFS